MAGYNPSTDSKWKVWLPVEGLGTFEVIMGGSFLPQGTSAPLVATVTSTGANPAIGASLWSVSRLAAGRFLVTLSGGWPTGSFSTDKIKNLRCSVQMHSLTNIKATIGPVNVATGAFEIDIVDPATGVLTDIAANANNSVMWHIHLGLGGPNAVQNV